MYIVPVQVRDCVCTCIEVDACTMYNVHVHVHVHIFEGVCLCTCTCTCTHVYTFVHVHVLNCTYKLLHFVCTYIHIVHVYTQEGDYPVCIHTCMSCMSCMCILRKVTILRPHNSALNARKP